MKKLVVLVCVALGVARGAQAQTDFGTTPEAGRNAAVDYAMTSAAKAYAGGPIDSARLTSRPELKRSQRPALFAGRQSFETSLAADSSGMRATTLSVAPPAAALPTSPTWEDVCLECHWQVSLGVTLVRFRSNIYFATATGVHTSVTRLLNDWLGIEGTVVSAFAPMIWDREHVKYAGYGVGPKITWRRPKIEPWAHAIVGGIHMLPKVSGQGKNGLELQLGMGVDYHLKRPFSAKLGIDWVPTRLWGQWENNAQSFLAIVCDF